MLWVVALEQLSLLLLPMPRRAIDLMHSEISIFFFILHPCLVANVVTVIIAATTSKPAGAPLLVLTMVQVVMGLTGVSVGVFSSPYLWGDIDPTTYPSPSPLASPSTCRDILFVAPIERLGSFSNSCNRVVAGHAPVEVVVVATRITS